MEATAQVTSAMSARETIISQLRQIAREQKVRLPPLTDDLVLLESGLDSLGFAILVARLEDTLGVDPFSIPDDVKFPVTLAEFIRSYEEMLPGGQVTSRSIGS